MKKILVILAVIAMFASCKSKTQELNLGDVMPTFTVNDTLSSASLELMKDRLTLVVFFASWCPGCQAELPYIQHVYTKYQGSNQIDILPIAREQTLEDVQSLWTEGSYTMPIYPDPKREIYAKFADKTIPRTYLFTPTGVLLFKSVGFSPEEMENLLELLNQNIVMP